MADPGERIERRICSHCTDSCDCDNRVNLYREMGAERWL